MAQKTLVMKFGGTSVGSADALMKVVAIIRDAQKSWPRLLVITSAMAGITNLLLEQAALAAQGDVSGLADAEELINQKHAQALAALRLTPDQRASVQQEISQLIASFAHLIKAIAVLGEASPRALDAVASLGERMSVRLLAAAVSAAGIDAQAIEASDLIVTNEQFQNAHPNFAATQQKVHCLINPLFENKILPITTGFIGATPAGVITTLGRGGSDYSAAILASVLPADEVWIWTDVDGVMTTDPRLEPRAQTLPEITYSEIAELAYYGAKVLHPKTIRPVVEAGIGLRICNTFNPSHAGTRLVANVPNNNQPNGEKHVIRAVTAIRPQRLINIEGRGMLGIPGVAARAFAAVASTGTSVPLITQASSEQSICFAVPKEAAQVVLTALEQVFALEINQHDIDRIWMTEDISIITVVGVNMRHTPGVAGRVFTCLGNSGANVLAIAQGSSEVSISMVVEEADTEKVVRALHQLIVE